MSEHCNEVAARYGYSDLHFVVADVTRDVLYSEHIDMLVTLHACDVATDYALHYAISRGVEHIFSVPCCSQSFASADAKEIKIVFLTTEGELSQSGKRSRPGACASEKLFSLRKRARLWRVRCRGVQSFSKKRDAVFNCVPLF